MTVTTWVYEAVENIARDGATVRDIQRWSDENRFEELAIDSIETALESLVQLERVEQDGTRFRVRARTSKEDALKKLFGD